MADMFDEAKKYQNMPKEPDMFDMYLEEYRANREEEKKLNQQREQTEKKAQKKRNPDTLSPCGYLMYKIWGGF